MPEDNEEQGGDQRQPGWQPVPGGLEPLQQLPAQRLHAIANAMSEEQKKDYTFITKARDRLRQCVPKFRRPSTDCWHLWKNAWRTACNNSMHPIADTDGLRFALKEALTGEARTGLASRYVRRELIKESHMFKTFEELRDSALTHISAQRGLGS
ncbi:MAG: hypothetical protein GY696_33410 [Gammaproteobacteria bacterium]|nr:hypothetical protein [Gammaproteobacteria bacterium]